MKKNRITKTDKAIFGSLYKAHRPLPVKRLARRVDVSWPTAKNSVMKLKKLGVVDVHKTIRRTNVELEDGFLKRIEPKLKRRRLR